MTFPESSAPGRAAPRPVPLERRRAAGALAGLLAFTAGFAVAGVLVVTGHGSTPPYAMALLVGLVGLGLVGFFLHRGTVELPRAPIWSPATLGLVVRSLGLPVVPVLAALYLLGLAGVVGNIVVPILLRR